MKALYILLLTFFIGACNTRADGNFYVGLGAGLNFADISNKTSASAYDEGAGEKEYHYFGNKKLKDKGGFLGKFYAGYIYDFSGYSLLVDAGYTVEDAEVEYGNENSRNGLELDGTPSSLAPTAIDPTITSMKLKRKHTVSIGGGIKKNLFSQFYILGGVDLLLSQFKYKSKGIADYVEGVNDVVKKKSKFGLGPWVSVSWDLGIFETGLRYQYSRYQNIKINGGYTPNKFSINNKIKPEYHTIVATITKKI